MTLFNLVFIIYNIAVVSLNYVFLLIFLLLLWKCDVLCSHYVGLSSKLPGQ